MAAWKPRSEDPVGEKEPLGRRLFDEPMLAGGLSDVNYDGLDVRNFQETRDLEFSLDRLGRTGIENKIVSYLRPRADHHAATKFHTPRTFNGWAVLRADQLTKAAMSVVASPIDGDGLQDLDKNIYHAHTLLPTDAAADSKKRLMHALYLRHLFAKGTMKPAPAAALRTADGATDERSGGRIARWFRSVGYFIGKLVRRQ